MADVRQKFIILGLVSLMLIGIPIRVDRPRENTHEALFLNYVTKYNKSYIHNRVEYNQRFKAFQESLELIEELNKNRTANSSALYGLTPFSDMGVDEFHHHHLRGSVAIRILERRLKSASALPSTSSELLNRLKRAVVDIPTKKDWRDDKVVTKVYSQKLCGACWAFSTVETLESMYAIKTGHLQSLSVQEMIDCSRNDNDGCAGGDICSLLSWMYDTKVNVQNATDYPLKWMTGVCQLKGPVAGVAIADYSCNSYVKNEKAIVKILATHGPVAVAVNALTWQNYLGGVIQYHCDGSLTMLNHAVQLVGYNLEAEIPYFIARNSWGPDFGENGYLKLAIGGNICGLSQEVARVFV